MKVPEVPTTDSGYPTPRDDLPSSSRSESPTSSPHDNQMTSTPVRGNPRRSIKEHFPKHELSIIESTGSESVLEGNDSNYVLDGVKSILAASKELKKKERMNTKLQDENATLRGENESLREENCSLREESRRLEMDASILPTTSDNEKVIPVVPKLQLHNINDDNEPVSAEQVTFSDKYKKELLSFIKSEEDRTILESKMENMFISDSKPPVNVLIATIQVDTDKIDADVQTESDDHVNVVNANLQIEVDQLHSDIEVIGKTKSDLENRLFNFEQLKAKFEADQQKLRLDLEKKLKASQAQLAKLEGKLVELQSRLNNKKKELDEVTGENKRLLEDINTHEFEIDELKVHDEHVTKQKRDLEEQIEKLNEQTQQLEEALQEEKRAKLQLEEKAENAEKDHANLVNELRGKAEEALRKEYEMLGKLEAVQKQSSSIVKENQYLSEAQKVLLDKEMNLKNEVNVLTANLRNTEAQLSMTKEHIAEEKRLKEGLTEEVDRLEVQNRKLIEEQYDSTELLEEVKKGKLEIDHLRQQNQLLSRDSEEVRKLKAELQKCATVEQKLKEKLERALKNEEESKSKLERYIRSETAATVELERLRVEVSEQNSKLAAAGEDVSTKAATIAELEQNLMGLRAEYEEFWASANAQYHSEKANQDEEIKSLRSRLRELETYPGKTISVSQRTREVQTDDVEVEDKKIPSISIVEEQVVSPEVSLVSEDIIPSHLLRLEEKLKQMVQHLKQVIRQQRIEDMSSDLQLSPVYHSSEIFKWIAECLETVLSDNNDEEGQTTSHIDNFWTSSNQRVQYILTVMNAKVEEAKKEYEKINQRSEQKWRKYSEKLKADLDTVKVLADQRGSIATEFKDLYDSEEKRAEEALRVVEMRNDELADCEEVEKDLRERLQQAEHEIQMKNRKELKRSEEFEAELDHLTAKLKTTDANHRREVSRMEEDLLMEKRKRAFDKETVRKSNANFDKLMSTCKYLRHRNTERQKLLIYMQKTVQEINDPNESAQKLTALSNHVKQSGLLKLNDEESGIERRVLQPAVNREN